MASKMVPNSGEEIDKLAKTFLELSAASIWNFSVNNFSQSHTVPNSSLEMLAGSLEDIAFKNFAGHHVGLRYILLDIINQAAAKK